MRKALVIFLTINVILVILLVRSVFTLLTLLVEDGLADAIHSAEIPAPNSPLIDTRPQLIPKIIHQTYVNESVPEHWREAQKSCIDLHEDYEYRVRPCFHLHPTPITLDGKWRNISGTNFGYGSSYGPTRSPEN